MSGTRAADPLRSASPGWRGSTHVPATGFQGRPLARPVTSRPTPASTASSSAGVRSRRHRAMSAAVAQPSSPVARTPKARASSRVGTWLSQAPLCTIARWKRPREIGEASWAHTARAPADWPASVTLCGSPPKRAALRRTQRSAAAWSISA
jgi:hypothetical protein